MKKGKIILAAMLAVSMLVPMAACGSSTASSSAAGSTAASGTAAAGGTITMSTNAEFEPFEYKSNNKIVGIDVDIGNKIAAKLGKTLQVRDVAFNSLSAELSAGKCDFVAAGMTINNDRKKNMDFSDPYFDAAQSIIVTKNSSIKSKDDLKDKKIGVQQGTTGDDYCTKNYSAPKRYNKGADAISDLISGRLDAVVIDDYPAQKFVSKNAGKIQKLSDALTVEHYAIAVKKGNTQLVTTINSVIKEMKSNGEMDKVISKYKETLENA
ncbi:MAG: transporter substrate-binding domain-containing protein [Oscillospiraceae bacterium]|jgi:polar amino acid transport system substrate-binding protein|nr:transporter substrate-binding domain-containing protein [Oscillospiraceae bacterium]MDD3260748.1 transporter substrate-binding domain-containing protein [Oscillospiraceae bacterium]